MSIDWEHECAGEILQGRLAVTTDESEVRVYLLDQGVIDALNDSEIEATVAYFDEPDAISAVLQLSCETDDVSEPVLVVRQ